MFAWTDKSEFMECFYCFDLILFVYSTFSQSFINKEWRLITMSHHSYMNHYSYDSACYYQQLQQKWSFYYQQNQYHYNTNRYASYQQQTSNSQSCDFQFAAGAPAFPAGPSITAASSLLTPTTLTSLERSFDLVPADSASVTAESTFVPTTVNPIVIDPSSSATMGIKTEYVHHLPTASCLATGIKREYEQTNWDDDGISSCSSNDWSGVSPNKRIKQGGSSVIGPPIDPQTFLVHNSKRPTGPRKERVPESVSENENNGLSFYNINTKTNLHS
jgi:hypothetical protein